MRFPLLLLCLVPALALSGPNADDPVAVLLTKSPTIDGNVTAAEWGDAPTGSGFLDQQTGQAVEGGKFWLAYDEQAIYFAAQVEMSDPKAIRADEFRDNVSLENDDSVYLSIETFGQLANFNSFGINSRGATAIQISGGRAAKREWLGEFRAMGRKTELGYEVEARIPWSIMRLPEPGQRDLRFNVFRNNPTTGRDSVWRYIRTNPENTARWQGVNVPSSGSQRSVKLLPYVYAGGDREGHIANGGLDLKTSLTDRIEAVGSINPDFRNIENQILSLDFSYFERLAGESRPFFLEGGTFFGTSRDAPLFASQRIRNFDAGFKVFGQVDDRTDVAILDTIDFGNRNNFVGKIGHRVTPTSSANFALTSLGQSQGPQNDAWFASYFDQKGAYGIFGQWSETKDTELGKGRRINTGITYGQGEYSGAVEYLEITPDYAPRLGFAPRRDLRGLSADLDWTHPTSKGSLMEYGAGVNVYDFKKTTGGPFSQGASLSTSTTWKNGLDFDNAVSFERFQGNDDIIFATSIELPRGNVYRRWEVGARLGRVAGRRYQGIGAGLSYRPLPTWQVSLSVQNLQHFERNTQTILTSSYDVNKSDSFSGRAVRVGSDTNFYLAYRRAGNKGAEYFVILGDPNARSFRTSLVLKASFPLELRF